MLESLFWSLLGLFFCTTLTHGRRGKHISLRDSSVLYAFSRGESAMEHISLRDSSFLYAFPGRESAMEHIILRDSSVLYAFSRGESDIEHISLRFFKLFICLCRE